MTQIQGTTALTDSLDFLRSKSFDTSLSQARQVGDSIGLIDQQVAAAKNSVAQGLNAGLLARSERVTAAFSRDESVSLKLLTAEGDKVTITFRDSQSVATDALQVDGPRTGFAEQQFSLARREAFDFRVEGNLNDEENQAIAELFLQLDELLAEFFSGDFSSAVALATSIELGDGTVSALSLDASLTTTTAIRRYESIANLNPGLDFVRSGATANNDLANSRSSESGKNSGLIRIEDVLAQLAQRAEELLAQFYDKTNVKAAAPETILNDLFALLLQVVDSSSAGQLDSESKQDSSQNPVGVVSGDEAVIDQAGSGTLRDQIVADTSESVE